MAEKYERDRGDEIVKGNSVFPAGSDAGTGERDLYGDREAPEDKAESEKEAEAGDAGEECTSVRSGDSTGDRADPSENGGDDAADQPNDGADDAADQPNDGADDAADQPNDGADDAADQPNDGADDAAEKSVDGTDAASAESRTPSETDEGQESKKRKSHFRRNLTIGLVCGLAAAAGGAYYYGYRELDGVFLPNTTINGRDVSRMDPEELSRKTEKTGADKVISIKTMEGDVETIPYADLEYRGIWAVSAEELQAGQNHYLWPLSLFQHDDIEVSTGFEYSEEALKDAVRGLNCISGKNIHDPKDASVIRNDKKKEYEISPSDDGNRLDAGAVLTAVRDTVESGQTNIDLKGQGCYKMALVHTDDKVIQDSFNVIDSVQKEELELYLYESRVMLNKDLFFDWISYDPAAMKVTVDRAQVDAYTHGLAEKLDTYRKPRLFTTAYGDTLMVGGGEDDTYGFIISESDTGDVIENAIPKGKSQEIEAIWRRTGRAITPDGDDIGDTYIEISIDSQHMWYFRDGECLLSTDVVTGLMTADRRSPTGVLYVIGKLTDYTMHGSYGSTHVNYAIMLNEDGVFIHDASWRSSFGGSIYLSNGSHGCINTPYDQVAELYDMVEDNTPVIIYDRNNM